MCKYIIVAIANSHIDDIYLFRVRRAESTMMNLTYAYCGNHKCEGKVFKNMATDAVSCQRKLQGLDPSVPSAHDMINLLLISIILYPSRVGEIIDYSYLRDWAIVVILL